MLISCRHIFLTLVASLFCGVCIPAGPESVFSDEPVGSLSSQRPNATIGHQVDLGLSVSWSDINFGAQSESDFGSYFGYSDLTGNQTSTSYDNYLSEDIAGTDYDPAFVFWGGGWRMPRESEIHELLELCDWHWTTRNGVDGYLVVGREGRSSIFLPAAGHRSGDRMFFEGTRGYYWSGEVNQFNPNYVSVLFFYKGDRRLMDCRKIYGYVLRPVHD